MPKQHKSTPKQSQREQLLLKISHYYQLQHLNNRPELILTEFLTKYCSLSRF